MNGALLILLLPLAAWSGWYVAMHKEAREQRRSKNITAYYEGIGFLLNDQTDKAIDAFLSVGASDRTNFDNQLTLGNLFRKRGEVDRALHLHENLRQRDALKPLECHRLDYELAQDFAAAGMLSEAQKLYENILQQGFERRAVMLQLLPIYERCALWQQAKNLCDDWQDSGYGNRCCEMAHYCCQLAEQFFENERPTEAILQLEQAINIDNNCARANIRKAKYYLLQQKYIAAIYALQLVGEQAPYLLSEVIDDLLFAYQQLQRKDEFINWLQIEEARRQNAQLTLILVRVYIENKQLQDAIALLKKRMISQKNPLFLFQWLQLNDGDNMLLLRDSLTESIKPQHTFRCNECGFRQQTLLWHCPSCGHWSSFRPHLECKISN